MRALADLFHPRTATGDLAHRQEAVLLSVLAGMAGLSVLTQLLQLGRFAVERDPLSMLWWLINVAFLVGTIRLAKLTRDGRPRLAASILIAVLSTLAFLVLLGDGIRNPMWSMVFGMCVVLGTLLLGLRVGIGVAIAGGASALLIAILQAIDAYDPLYGGSGTPVTNGAGTFVVLVFLALVCVLYTRDPGTSLDELVTERPAQSPLRELRVASLSVREIEVVRLLTEGLTYKEIGGRLFISPRTVERHVSNAVAKTGTANRTALTILAVQEGLAAEPPGEAA